MYIGMCVGHYKCEGADRIEKVKRLAAMGLKYLNGVSVPGDAPKSELREMKQVRSEASQMRNDAWPYRAHQRCSFRHLARM